MFENLSAVCRHRFRNTSKCKYSCQLHVKVGEKQRPIRFVAKRTPDTVLWGRPTLCHSVENR